MPKHRRTAHGFSVEREGNTVWVTFITAEDLLKHAGTWVAFTNELQRAFDIGFELERRKRLGLLRTVFALDSETTLKEIEEIALRHGVDISFVKDTPEARGRKKHSEAHVDVELLEEVEAYKSLHRFRSVRRTLEHLADEFPEFLDAFVSPYDYGLTTRAKQISTLNVRLSQLKKLLQRTGWAATSDTGLAKLIRREVAVAGETVDMRRRQAEVFLSERRRDYYRKK
jgi:hypothetical protein